MKAVISNFSTFKTLYFIKTLPGAIIFFMFFSCQSTNPSHSIARHSYYDTKIRKEIVEKSSSFIGIKYRYGGKTPNSGFDCSGLVQYVYRKEGLILPGSAKSQAKIGRKVKLKNTKPGDLVFFKNRGRINHVGIVVKNNGRSLMVVHSTTSKGVKKDDVLNSKYWKKRFTFARDVISR